MIGRRSAVALVLAVWFGVWSCSSATADDAAVPDYQNRSFGVLIIDYRVDDQVAQVVVKLQLGGEQIGAFVLSPDAPEYEFNKIAGTATASGSLRLNLQVPPQFSSLEGDFQVKSGDAAAVPFKGSVADWTASDYLIFVKRSEWLTSEIEVQTEVLSSSRNIAHISIWFSQAKVYEVTIVPDSSTVKLPRLTSGNIQIEPGAKLTLTPPSLLQSGKVFMEGSFMTDSVPLTPISKAVATWPLGTPPNSRGDHDGRTAIPTGSGVQPLPAPGSRSGWLVRIHARPERYQSERADNDRGRPQ